MINAMHTIMAVAAELQYLIVLHLEIIAAQQLMKKVPVVQKYKIAFVLRKAIMEAKYKEILVEVKKGLFSEVKNEFPSELKKLVFE